MLLDEATSALDAESESLVRFLLDWKQFYVPGFEVRMFFEPTCLQKL